MPPAHAPPAPSCGEAAIASLPGFHPHRSAKVQFIRKFGATSELQYRGTRLVQEQQMNHPLIVRASPFSVKETVDRLQLLLASKTVQVFARIDHAVGARAAGLTLPDEEVLIFGDPKVGTFLMQECAPLGIELPLRILVWQGKQTQVAYRDPLDWLAEYKIEQHRGIIEKMSQLLASVVEQITKGLIAAYRGDCPARVLRDSTAGSEAAVTRRRQFELRLLASTFLTPTYPLPINQFAV